MIKRRLLWALALLLLPQGAAAQTKVDQRFWVAPDGFIRLFQMAGTIRVQGWDRDTLAITGTMSTSGDGEFVMSPGKQGAKASLWATTGTARGDLVVRVPRKAQTLWLKTQDAHVTIQDFEGSVDISTVTGNVELAGRPSELYIESMGGNVNLSVTSRSVRVKTASGQITVRGAIDDATLATVSGPIFAIDTRLTQARIESIDGKLTYQGEFASPGRIEFSNHAGAVELLLSPKAAGEFSISTFGGAIKNELGVRFRELPTKGGKSSWYSFSLGSGVDNEISITTFKGDVILRRLGVMKKVE